nr:putative metalloprotease CJM1_0395 family protein [Shewanella submarina]
MSYRLGRGAMTVTGLTSGRLRSDNPAPDVSSVATAVRVSSHMDASASAQSLSLPDSDYAQQSVTFNIESVIDSSGGQPGTRLGEPGQASALSGASGSLTEANPGYASGLNVAPQGSGGSDIREGTGTQGANNQDSAEQEAIPAVGEQTQNGDETQAQGRPNDTSEEQSPAVEKEPRGNSRQEAVEQQELEQLRARDREVKSHERAHAAVGGHYASSPSYQFERGSDGKRYAISGEVQIDISPVPGDPQATVVKMQKVYAAAMAPVNPSMADIRVAAEAMEKLNVAKQELAVERQEQLQASQQTLLGADAAIDETPVLEPRQPSIGQSIDEQGNVRQEEAADNAFVIAQPDSQRTNEVGTNQRLSPDSTGTDFAQGTVIAPPRATLQLDDAQPRRIRVNGPESSSISKEGDKQPLNASELQQVKMAIEKRYGIAPKSQRVA